MSDYKEYFKDKKITLMGLGLLGRGIGDARFLAQCGAELLVTDKKSKEDLAPALEELKEFSNITYCLGEHKLEDFRDRDLIIKAAGVPLDSVYIAEAQKHNIPVRMSADLFAELSGVPIVGITGTRGKSTVTHLLAHILKTAHREGLSSPEGRAGRTGLEPVLGGNIKGVSNLQLLNEVTQDSIAVLELDSWQLQGFGEAKISPHVAVFTTFMPDHMNYYGSTTLTTSDAMERYFADKANIFINQKEEDFLVLGEQVATQLKEYGYDKKIKAHTVVAGAKNLPKQWKIQIPGEHNRYNVGLAIAAADILGVETDTICKAVESFKGVHGRLELIREVGGVKIYNDTTATVPEATVAALRALDPEMKKNIILIMGGADKGLNMNELLEEIPNHCKATVLLAGTGTDRLLVSDYDLKANQKPYTDLSLALEGALGVAKSGDTVLFSPAFASFGMFKNEYDRGEQFNKIVEAL